MAGMKRLSATKARSGERVIRTKPAMPGRFLLLAGLPPPVHGVSTMSKAVHDHVQTIPDISCDHLWSGGARQIEDVGRKSVRKISGFGVLLTRLLGNSVLARHYDLAYVTLAPEGDALARDGLLIMAAKRAASRVLVHLHTRGLENILEGASRLDRFTRRAIKNCELICVSASTADMARRSGHFSQVYHLPNHVPDPWPAGAQTLVRPSVNNDMPPARALRYGYLGNLDARKGVLRFIDILAELKQAGLVFDAQIAGGPTRNLSIADVATYADDRGVGDEVIVRGFATGPAKQDFLQQLDIMIYPSTHDLAPLVLIEALAHGVVPIAFDTGAVAELLAPDFDTHVIEHKPCEAGRQSAIEKVVRICARYDSDRTALRLDQSRARRRYEQNYTPDLFRARLSAIISGESTCSSNTVSAGSYQSSGLQGSRHR